MLHNPNRLHLQTVYYNTQVFDVSSNTRISVIKVCLSSESSDDTWLHH